MRMVLDSRIAQPLDNDPQLSDCRKFRDADAWTNYVGSRPDTDASSIWLCNLQLTRRNGMKKLIDRHRDIQYTLTNIEPDLWSWSFEINGKIRQGTTRARLGLLAQRRVCTLIDRELKSAERDKPKKPD